MIEGLCGKERNTQQKKEKKDDLFFEKKFTETFELGITHLTYKCARNAALKQVIFAEEAHLSLIFNRCLPVHRCGEVNCVDHIASLILRHMIIS